MCTELQAPLTIELPDGFDDLSFWPLGIPGKQTRPLARRFNRLLVVSPFLSESFLSEATKTSDDAILVSRLESLQEDSSREGPRRRSAQC